MLKQLQKGRRQWKYESARKKGKAAAVFLTITVLLEPALA
jgi:hypothetical protein